jgi:uncharacterized protein YukE
VSERSLVVHQDALATIESALAAATTDITTQITDLLAQVDALTPAWEPTSESHLAQVEHQQRLLDGVARLTEALDSVKASLATYREDAREIEVENVAVIG